MPSFESFFACTFAALASVLFNKLAAEGIGGGRGEPDGDCKVALASLLCTFSDSLACNEAFSLFCDSKINGFTNNDPF